MHMQRAIDLTCRPFKSISSVLEMGAYEAIWDLPGMSFKKAAEMFRGRPDAIPSDFVNQEQALKYYNLANGYLTDANVRDFGVRVHGAGEYPEKLRDAAYPIELLYFRGWWDLAATRSVAVVGTRHPTPEGILRTRKLIRELVKDNFTIVSGLASGIDTTAHTEAILQGGKTVAVIGTPLSEAYPQDNAELQERIAREYLLISQIPIVRYGRFGPKFNRLFFPERNITMSALTEATIIIEAGNTSGTLIQARAALNQKRKLFILDNCFRNAELTWPTKYEKLGAIRVAEYDDIREHLSVAASHPN